MATCFVNLPRAVVAKEEGENAFDYDSQLLQRNHTYDMSFSSRFVILPLTSNQNLRGTEEASY